jgi:hypothetical protein
MCVVLIHSVDLTAPVPEGYEWISYSGMEDEFCYDIDCELMHGPGVNFECNNPILIVILICTQTRIGSCM